MSFAEKRTWVYLAATVLVYLGYVIVVVGRAGGEPLVEAAYMWPLVIAIGATILATIAGSILVAVVSAQDGERHFDPDERDRAIGKVVRYPVFHLLRAGRFQVVIG